VVLDYMEERYLVEDGIDEVPADVAAQFEVLNGSTPGGLVVVAATPVVGRASLPARLVHHVARNLAQPVVVFSPEGGEIQFTERLMALDARADHRRIHYGPWSETDWTRVGGAVVRLKDLPIYFREIPWDDPFEVQCCARELADTGGLGLIVVDSMDRLRGDGPVPHGGRQVGALWNSLAVVSREQRVPMVLVMNVGHELVLEDRQAEGEDGAQTSRRGLRAKRDAAIVLMHGPRFTHGSSTRE
jgi:replicative DNA helicase